MDKADRPAPQSTPRPRWHSVAVLVTIAPALLVVVPACSSSTNPAAAPPTTSSTTVAKSTSTTSPVTLPEQNPAEIATCNADVESLQVALEAYLAEKGAYPSPPAPWSAATYVDNYQPLTAASGGGPLLHTAPGTKYYVIEYDATGHVWVAPPGIYQSYNRGQDIAVIPSICDAAVG